jgi:hypothetical protein
MWPGGLFELFPELLELGGQVAEVLAQLGDFGFELGHAAALGGRAGAAAVAGGGFFAR